MKRQCKICIVSILICFSGALAQPQPTSRVMGDQFDRRWFMNAPNGEIKGFINGYYDCLPNPAQRSMPGWSMPTKSMVDRITDFYAQHKATRLNVAQVAQKVAANGPVSHPAPGGEVYTNRHGYYDGLWWKGASGDEQLGYVEGYLVCLKRQAPKSESQRTAIAISNWYRKHPSKEDRAIAYVFENILMTPESAR